MAGMLHLIHMILYIGYSEWKEGLSIVNMLIKFFVFVRWDSIPFYAYIRVYDVEFIKVYNDRFNAKPSLLFNGNV